MKSKNAPLRATMVEVPFKLLLIDGESHNWMVCNAGENARESFKEFHGRAAGRRAVLWIIPKDVTVFADLNYKIPADSTYFDWVKIGEVR